MMVAKRRSRATFCLALLSCMHFSLYCDAISTVREIQKPEHPIGKEVDDGLNSRKTDAFRGLRSGKDYKSSKSSKSNKSEKHVESYVYYQDTQYSKSNDTPKTPASSPAHRRKSDHYQDYVYSKPAQKPGTYYDPNDTSKYDSYSDMIDYYYIHHKEDSDSIDEPIKPSPRPPTQAPGKRPFVDYPNWSYSEDEDTEVPTLMPSNSPSVSQSTGQCLVSVGLDQCSSLLDTIEPKEDCDCYNFCGGIYLGCCVLGEPCPLSCEVLGGFVAGCTFQSSPSPATPSPDGPSMNPSIEPTLPSSGTYSPTQDPPPSDATSAPTNDIISISLEPFTLEYEITFSRPIARSDLVVLGSITNSYLQIYMSGTFQSDSINLADFVTEYSSYVEDPGSSVVLVTFKSTALFDPTTRELPSRIDLEKELASAFQELALVGYLGRVQALPASNAFSTTSDIFMVENPPSVSTLESRKFSGVAAATAIFAVAIVTSFASFSWYRTRRRQRRIKASDSFFRRASIPDSAKDLNIRKSLGHDTQLDHRGERISTKLLEESESIDDMSRGYEDYPKEEEFHPADRVGVSQRSEYTGDETYLGLYEDDTVDNHDEDYSLKKDVTYG